MGSCPNFAFRMKSTIRHGTNSFHLSLLISLLLHMYKTKTKNIKTEHIYKNKV